MVWMLMRVCVCVWDRPRQLALPLLSSWAPVTLPVFKPWLDETDPEHVFFASINLFAGTIPTPPIPLPNPVTTAAEDQFYPGSGREEENPEYPNIMNLTMTPVLTNNLPPWINTKAKAAMSATKKQENCRKASEEFRYVR